MSIYATKNGVWSDTTVWNTGVLPGAVDIVRPNNFTVTIDISVTVTEIRNDAGGGAVLGGSFTLNDGVTVTASNGFFGTYASAAIGLLNYGGAGSVIINGNVEGSKSSVTNTFAISNDSSGTITINGNLSSAGSGASSQTLRNQSTGAFIINGNLTSVSGILIRNDDGTTTITGNITSSGGRSITNSAGTVTINGNVSHTQTGQALITIIDNLDSGNITITGDISSAITVNVNAASGNLIRNNSSGTISIIGELSLTSFANTNSNTTASILNNSNGIINVTGSVIGQNRTGSFNSSGILNSSTGVVNVTGIVQAGATLALGGSYAVRNVGLGVVNVIGTVLGNGGDNRLCGIGNDGGGTVNVTGNIIGGLTGLAVVNNAAGNVFINGNAVGGTSYAAIEGVNSAGNTVIENIVFGTNGQSATRGYIKFKNSVSISAQTVLLTDNTTINLVDINLVDINLQPSISDVRSGVTYSSGSLTGTMNVPPFNAVKAGVPVDNGVGTAALEPNDVWNVLISGLTQSGSIGVRLKNVATVETTGTQIASFNV